VIDIAGSRFIPCNGVTDARAVSALAWNQRGDRLALGLQDGTIRVLTKSPATGCAGFSSELDIPAHTTVVTTVSWHDDVLASGSNDGSARLWTMPRDADDRALLSMLSELAASSAASGSTSLDPRSLKTAGLFEMLGRRVEALRKTPQ
jgi:WD40 repeat protein